MPWCIGKPSSRPQQPHDNESNHQRDGRDDLEVDERAQADAPHVFHRAHVCDANDDGRENDRGDHHLHELDETVAERLHRRGSFRRDEPDTDPKRDADQDLEVEARIEWLPRRARHSLRQPGEPHDRTQRSQRAQSKTGFLCGLRGLCVPPWRQLVAHTPWMYNSELPEPAERICSARSAVNALIVAICRLTSPTSLTYPTHRTYPTHPTHPTHRASPTYCVPVRRVGYLIPSCSRYDL